MKMNIGSVGEERRRGGDFWSGFLRELDTFSRGARQTSVQRDHGLDALGLGARTAAVDADVSTPTGR